MKDYDAAFRIPNCNQVQCTPESSSDGVDVVIHPTAIQPAPKLDDNLSGRVELDSYVQDVMTVPASLAGLPAISIPTGVGKDGWPLGMSIVGQWGTDELVLQTAQLIEDAISS
jgi:aspartyl-tRNA(Asn)/glutamyl-tRNA(Gln) amidotransferase subunit A